MQTSVVSVHEASLRLRGGAKPPDLATRDHGFDTAAQPTRWIVTDHARPSSPSATAATGSAVGR